MSTSIWVVVPCCREKQIRWVVDGFRRQEHPDKQLCIVENGEAVGACERLGICPHLIVTSEAQVGRARNAGMYAIRERGGGWISMWDDDDWYGPAYLSEAAELIETGKANIYGKQRHFVATPNSGMALFNEKGQNKYAYHIHGPTLVFRAEEGRAFHEQKEAEEIRWCHDMMKLGARIWSSSIHHLLYLRYGADHDHTWEANDSKVGFASMSNDYAYVLDSTDMRIVTGEEDWRDHVVERHGERTPDPFIFNAPMVPVRVMPPQKWDDSPRWATAEVGR